MEFSSFRIWTLGDTGRLISHWEKKFQADTKPRLNDNCQRRRGNDKSTLTRLSLTNLADVFMLFWLSVLFRSFWKNWSFFRWRMNTRILAHDCPRITDIRIATKTQFCCQRTPRRNVKNEILECKIRGKFKVLHSLHFVTLLDNWDLLCEIYFVTQIPKRKSFIMLASQNNISWWKNWLILI